MLLKDAEEEEGREMSSCAIRSDVAMQVEYAAELPRPAAMGRLDEAVKVAAKLQGQYVSSKNREIARAQSDCSTAQLEHGPLRSTVG